MSRTFFRKFSPAVPRAAGRPALRASALRGGEFGIIRAPGAPGAGNPPAHRMPTTPARRSGGDGGRFGWEGGIGLALRPAPHARPSRGPGARGTEPSGAADSTARIQLPIYRQEDRPRLQTRGFPPIMQTAFSRPPRFPIRIRRTSHEANTSRDCFQRPRARRRVPSCSRP